jgi:hypothetical protein
LVPRDVNGAWDVYEWEPVGVGSCGVGSGGGAVVFEPGRSVSVGGRVVSGGAGCVGLVSSGSSPEESGFLDASESGGDVFFLTTARLAPQDFDSAFDVYDAHECTALSPCAPAGASVPSACVTAEACRAAPSLQPALFGAPSSETFSGEGNVPPLTAAKPRGLTRAEKLSVALRVCRRDRVKRKRVVCERAARKRYGPKPAGKASRKTGKGAASGRASGRGKRGGR